MMLIIVTLIGDGSKAYVNPNNICAVYPDVQIEGATIIQFVGSDEKYIRVLESVDSIANMVGNMTANEVIDALEKQQPMETGPDELGISARNPVITPCGNCGTELTDRMWSYCPWCGQKIKWRKR